MKTETLIIGGGLSGLYTAYQLHAEGRPFHLLEARPRFGGRVQTVNHDGISLELGASWFWPHTNPRVAKLVSHFQLESFQQYTHGNILVERSGRPPEQHPHGAIDSRISLRLKNGTSSLFKALLDTLPPEQLHSEHSVNSIAQYRDGTIMVEASSNEEKQTFIADNVIVTIPLRLAEKSLSFTPPLPSSTLDHFRAIPTWMAGEAKFLAVYPEPFWRESGFSGSVFSETGPLSECHDASPPDGSGAILGFLQPDAKARKSLGDNLIPACIDQLTRHFGSKAASPSKTILMDWATEPLTSTSEDASLAGHPIYNTPLDKLRHWDGHLLFAGTESVTHNGGYLEGALESAEQAVRDLKIMMS